MSTDWLLPHPTSSCQMTSSTGSSGCAIFAALFPQNPTIKIGMVIPLHRDLHVPRYAVVGDCYTLMGVGHVEATIQMSAKKKAVMAPLRFPGTDPRTEHTSYNKYLNHTRLLEA
nr:hypothetical protein CFP56_01366 [Quercus suber]